MQNMTRHIATSLCLAVLCASPVLAQTGSYPEKPVRVLVPYAPGGGADVVARILGEQLRKETGQPFVVENKPGAFGIVAIEEVARAKPDGYTLMVGNVSTNTITPLLYASKFSIDYEKSIAPVARVANLPSFLAITTTGFPVTNFAEFLDYVKKNPGKVRYGSAGVGSFPHFDMAILAKRAGLDMIHIPNKDGAAGVNKDLATGDSQVGLVNVGTAAAGVKAGLMRPIAVVFDKRLAEYPEVPTLAELGFPDVGTVQWIGVFTRAGTSKPIVAFLVSRINKALHAETVQYAFDKASYYIDPTTSPEEGGEWIASDSARWRKIIGEAKVDLAD